ncbi:MAG: SUMF1/EgtB/PvdO family nonheme iron enzyme, partial [Verrucomicrobia bacterium]|nr:SUMF1/EgtB/PvdO family nonheme iron enzyme [Verrucomicrobiota bacterium]
WAGGRLPTEDEWFAEASNGGRRKYAWGDVEVTCDLAIWGGGKKMDGCGADRTWPVCSKRGGYSISGLCDLTGNVREWTSSVDANLDVDVNPVTQNQSRTSS